MSTETELQNQDGKTSTQTEGEKTSTPSEGATFTQDQVNDMIQARLARESGKYEDYAELKAFKEKSESEAMTETQRLQAKVDELTPLAEAAQARGDLLNGILEDEMKRIPEDKKTLVPEAFSTEQKLTFIRSNAQYFSIDKPVMTPDGKKPKEGKTGAFGGKYETKEEFALKDPQGYIEARKSGKL